MAVEITLSPTQDADIINLTPDTNYGDGDYVRVGWLAAKTNLVNRGLMDFDVSQIPVGSTILEAYLGIGVALAIGTPWIAGLRRLTTEWLEEYATWNTAREDPPAAMLWDTAGGDYTTWGGMGEQPTISISASTGNFSSSSLVIPVMDAVENRDGLLSMMIKHPTEAGSNATVSVISGEMGIHTPYDPPFLFVSYDPPYGWQRLAGVPGKVMTSMMKGNLQ